MCDILDEMRNETEQKTRIENARKMLKSSKLSLEEIAEFPGLTLEKVRELAGDQSA